MTRARQDRPLQILPSWPGDPEKIAEPVLAAVLSIRRHRLKYCIYRILDHDFQNERKLS